MNSRPPEQVFSSELIYQTVNAVRLFDEQVHGLKEQLLTRLNKTSRVDDRQFSISNFYFVQRRWANCTVDSSHPLAPWFDYSFYAVDSFDNLKVGALINSFNESEKWEYLFKYIDIHYPRKPKIISEAIAWINNNLPRLAQLVKAGDPLSRPKFTEFSDLDRRLLHHHLLQLYSRFPTRNYIHGGLYKEFIEKYAFGDAQPARAYYIYILKCGNDPYPPYRVWELERGVTPKAQGSQQKEDIEDVGITADPIRKPAVDFFTRYLAPLFIEPGFNGRREFDLNRGSIDHMLWLPLYDECIDGRFHGFFRGWLFQVVSENIEGSGKGEATPLFNGNNRLTRERLGTLVEYTSSCLKLSQSLVSDINRAIMREMLNQDTFRENPYDVLTNNLCLMGDWHNPITRGLTETNKNTFKELGGIDEGGRPTTLSINLDAPFLERGSDTYVSFDEVNEDPKEEHRELFLKFGSDFRHPEGDATVYYDQLVNHIYLLFARLKNAKWADIQSQKQGQLEEARLQVGRWAHALQTKLALLEEIFGRDASTSINDPAVRANVRISLRSLRQTITTLAYYQRVVDYLRASKTNLRELNHKPGQRFPEFTRSLGHLLFDAFTLMAAKVNLNEGRYADIERKLPNFFESCKAATTLALNRTDSSGDAISLNELSTFFPTDESVSFELRPGNAELLSNCAVWEDINIISDQGDIKFNYAVAIGVVVDEILSNACKYVSRVDGKAGIHIQLRLETDDVGRWATFEVTNTAAYQDLGIELGAGRDLIEYEERKTAKGQGLFFNRELCEMLVGDWKNNYTVTVADNLRCVRARFRFPIGALTQKR